MYGVFEGEFSGSEKAVDDGVLSADVGVEFLKLCVVPGDGGLGHVDEFVGEVFVDGW